MKILFIVADNYPETGACTSLLNNLFFYGRMKESVCSVDVLAFKSKVVRLKHKKYDFITVHETFLRSKISSEQYKQNFLKHPLITSKGFMAKFIKKISSREINRNDVNVIKKSMKRIDADAYDVVVAVMGSFEVAAAAMEYKKKNSDLKLIVYQVDPCSTNEVCPTSTQKERRCFEKNLYAVSDRIITTPILLEEAKALYSKEITEKLVPMEFPNVVPCGEERQKGTDIIRCVFAGSIYGNFRDPGYTLKLFDGVDSFVRFEFVGAVKPEIKNKLCEHNVIYHGTKSLDETRKELMDADILVNIGNKMLNQVPSKLFEYISYGKPIINICKNRNCPTIPYLEKYKYALNLYEEDDIFEEQVKMLNDFILENYKNRMTADEISEAFETCTPQYCAEQMLDVFKSL